VSGRCRERSDPGTTADEVPDEGNRGHDQQRVNQPASDVKHDEPEYPTHQEDKKEYQEHGDLQA
jgi:hypothetical protein